MAKSLVIVRAGRKSLHNAWIDWGKDSSWDLFVCPFEEIAAQTNTTAGVMIGDVIPGAKWSGLSKLLGSWSNWKSYDYILLADDDLFALPSTWSKYFEIVQQEAPLLSQPALTRDSYFWHLLTAQNSSFSMRQTNFVEVMLPCFRRDALEMLLPTFDFTGSGWGWGLDYVWGHLLNHQGMLIVDDTPVQHTRPVGSMTNQKLKAQIAAEMNAMLQVFGASTNTKTTVGRLRNGQWLGLDDPEFIRNYIKGYWHLIEDNSELFRSLIVHQFR